MTIKQLINILEMYEDHDAEVIIAEPEVYGMHQSTLCIIDCDHAERGGREVPCLLTEME